MENSVQNAVRQSLLKADGHVHAELLIQVNSAQSADSRVRQDRGPAAVELLIRVNSVRNVDDQDHNLRR